MSVNKDIIIALDEGTTNAKAVALDAKGHVVASFSQALAIQTPHEGWVEQSAELLVAASRGSRPDDCLRRGRSRCCAGNQQST